MANEWPRVAVAEICDVFLGGTPRRSEPAYWGGSIKWATAKDVAGCSTRYLISTEETITPRGIEESAAKLLSKDTVVITARGTVGALCMLGEPMSFNQTCYGLVGKKDTIIQHYLYYALKAALSQVHSFSYGTVFDTITMKTFEDILIFLPSLAEQRRIAHILGTLDDKIELNRRMNRTLEKMAQAIFKSWFIDFDPVRAKAEGRDPNLPKEIADLFPDSFEDSEIGPIPKGWKLSTVGAEFNLTMGQSPPGTTYNESGEGTPFFQGRKDFGFRYPTNRVYCTAPTRFANKDDTLVSVRAPVGDVNMAMERCCVGQGVAAVRHMSGSRSYTYYAMRALGERFQTYEAQGTVFGSISKKEFQALAWIVPPEPLVERFERFVSPLDQRIEVNEKQNRHLAEMRDTLLPRILSGKLGIPNAEKFMETNI